MHLFPLFTQEFVCVFVCICCVSVSSCQMCVSFPPQTQGLSCDFYYKQLYFRCNNSTLMARGMTIFFFQLGYNRYFYLFIYIAYSSTVGSSIMVSYKEYKVYTIRPPDPPSAQGKRQTCRVTHFKNTRRFLRLDFRRPYYFRRVAPPQTVLN